MSTLFAERYRVERELGRGGMSTVHLATDTVLDRTVALKVLAERFDGDDEVRPRFLREGRLAARLSHPNVVRVFDTGADPQPHIVMEVVDGVSLAEELERRQRLPADEVVGIGRQAAAGLAHAHAHGLVHRDVKPQNLLRGDDGLLKLVDFGIARGGEGHTITEAGTLLGTAGYMAPEVVAGERAEPPADVYALGAVLYELVTGRPPRVVTTLDDLDPDVPVTDVAELAPDTPPELADGIRRALDRDPAARPTAAELADLLGAGATAVTTVAAPPTRKTVVERRPAVAGGRAPGRRVWPAALAAVLLLALAGLGLAFATGDDEPAQRAEQARVEPVPQGATPADEARNLADWLRENAG
ncbi:MAG TPA: serine/threonine-protein kinase [Gaiellaceae bacterium]|nr:serine/threonine-protein kinase [Gaiellaceae bacterium]